MFSQGFLHVKECSVLDSAEVLFIIKGICQIQMQTIQIQLSRNKGKTYFPDSRPSEFSCSVLSA